MRNRLKPLLLSVLFVAVFVTGMMVGGAGSDFGAYASEEMSGELDLRVFFETHELLERHFQSASSTSERVSNEEKMWGAIQGLTSSYGDPYTVFLPPKEKEIFESQVRGDFQGVGMEIGIRDGVLIVVAPLKNTPAYRAGLESGDRILAIDGVVTTGISVESAVSKIRGEKGTPVTLTISRDDLAPFDVAIVRDIIELPTLETEMSEGVFIIRLFNFNALAPLKFRDALREFADSPTEKMIIDLRGNPGGYLEVAVDIASWFLPVGAPIVIEDHRVDARDHTHRSRGYDVFNDNLRLVILVDEGSASASEILAGALRENGVGVVMGMPTFGKGSVQQVFDVSGDASVKVTIAHWLTPQGSSISDGGIIPDIEVEITEEDEEREYDAQREAAIRFLNEGWGME